MRPSTHRPALTLVFGVAMTLAAVARADAPPGRFTAGTAVVTDTVTGLVWQRSIVSTWDWASAGTYCASLAIGGKNSGWRVPAVKELFSIVDLRRKDPTLDPVAFPDPQTPPTSFWTGEGIAGSDHYIIDFSTGRLATANSGNGNRVRCVHDP